LNETEEKLFLFRVFGSDLTFIRAVEREKENFFDPFSIGRVRLAK
jgi:hypothetical protein